jgi:hypothetical protein
MVRVVSFQSMRNSSYSKLLVVHFKPSYFIFPKITVVLYRARIFLIELHTLCAPKAQMTRVSIGWKHELLGTIGHNFGVGELLFVVDLQLCILQEVKLSLQSYRSLNSTADSGIVILIDDL